MVSLTLSVIIFVVIVVAAVHNRDSVREVIQKADPFWLGTGALCFTLNYLFRAYRLWLYTNKSGLLFPAYLKITSIHGFNTYFLPMRSGDLTLPFLLRLHAEVPLTLGSRILVRARMLDISSLGYLLCCASLMTSSGISVSWRMLMLGLGLGFVLIPYLAIYMFRRGPNRMKLWLDKLVGTGKPSYPALVETLISLVIWFWIGCTFYCVIRSLSIPLAFYDVWLLIAIQLPLQMLPVQGLANSGNHEAGWVLALSLFGVPASDGLPIALASHVAFILYAILLGAAAILLPSVKSRG